MGVVELKKRGKRVSIRPSRENPWIEIREGQAIDLGGLVVSVSHKNGRTKLCRYYNGSQLKPENIGDGTYKVGLRDIQKL